MVASVRFNLSVSISSILRIINALEFFLKKQLLSFPMIIAKFPLILRSSSIRQIHLKSRDSDSSAQQNTGGVHSKNTVNALIQHCN